MVAVFNNSPSWAHTHAIAAATTDANVLKDAGAIAADANSVSASGALALRNATETGAAAVCGSLSCTGAHPNSVVAQRSNILEAPGAAKATHLSVTTPSKVAVVVSVPTTTGAAV